MTYVHVQPPINVQLSLSLASSQHLHSLDSHFSRSGGMILLQCVIVADRILHSLTTGNERHWEEWFERLID